MFLLWNPFNVRDLLQPHRPPTVSRHTRTQIDKQTDTHQPHETISRRRLHLQLHDKIKVDHREQHSNTTRQHNDAITSHDHRGRRQRQQQPQTQHACPLKCTGSTMPVPECCSFCKVCISNFFCILHFTFHGQPPEADGKPSFSAYLTIRITMSCLWSASSLFQCDWLSARIHSLKSMSFVVRCSSFVRCRLSPLRHRLLLDSLGR